MNHLTTQELEAIRQRAEKATEGPWKVFEKGEERNIGTSWEHPQLRDSMPVVTLGIYAKEPHHRVYIKEENADFIAHAREDVPLLLAEVDRLNSKIGFYLDEFERRQKLYDDLARKFAISGGDMQ